MEITELAGMLAPEAIRDSIVSFSKPADERDMMKDRALEFFRANPGANINQLTNHLGCSKRSVERIVSELKSSGSLLRKGSARVGKRIVAE